MRYADRVKKDPTRSAVHSMKEANEAHFSVQGETDEVVMTGQDKTILATFGLAFGLMMYGVIPWQDMGIGLPTLWWWFPEMTALFILFSVIIGLIGRLSEVDLTDSFVNGARDLLGVALIIGIARGITVVMNNGGITDTVLHWAEVAVEGLSPVTFSIVVFLLFLPLSFLIPSSSGLATVAMPILAPLAAFVGVQADLIVTAFQSASGLMNLFIPTSAVVMGGLAIARVPYGTYLRWVWPLLAMLAASSSSSSGRNGSGLSRSVSAGTRPAAWSASAAPSVIGSPCPTRIVRGASRAILSTEASAAAMSSVNSGLEPASPSLLFSASPATRTPVSSSKTERCPAVWPGVPTICSPNTSSPSPSTLSPSASTSERSAWPMYPVAEVASVSTSLMLPAWSGCLWVRTTCRTPAHPGPAWSSTSPMASVLPPTPVSTTAASLPRTST